MDVDGRPGLAPVEGDDEMALGVGREVEEEEEDGCRVVAGEAPAEVRVGGLIGLKLTVTVPEPSSSSTTSSLLFLFMSLAGLPPYRRLPCQCPCPPKRFDTNYRSE